MSKDYSVVQADHKNDWEGKFGPMRSYALQLEELPMGSGIVHDVEMNQKPTTRPPTAGETVSGDITPSSNPDFPPKFKKEFRGGESPSEWSKKGAFKPRDPSEIAGARHAHNLLVAAHTLPVLGVEADGHPSAAAIQRRLDDLEAFACVLDEKTAAISDAAKAAASGAATVEKEASKAEPDLPF